MGPALFTAFRTAGLPGPHLLVEAFAEGGPGAPAWAWANVISATVPLMERLLADTLACDGCVIGPPMTGAWVRTAG